MRDKPRPEVASEEGEDGLLDALLDELPPQPAYQSYPATQAPFYPQRQPQHPRSPQEWPEERPERRSDPQRQPQRRRSQQLPRRWTTYDRWTKGAGLIVAFGLVGLMWWAGAYFTLRWLSSMGLALASAGAIAYLIPASITLVEIGLWPQKAGSAISRGFWFAILTFDVATTAAGVVVYTKGETLLGRPIEGVMAWGLGGLAGLLLALLPERAGRALWREFRELF